MNFFNRMFWFFFTIAKFFIISDHPIKELVHFYDKYFLQRRETELGFIIK